MNGCAKVEQLRDCAEYIGAGADGNGTCTEAPGVTGILEQIVGQERVKVCNGVAIDANALCEIHSSSIAASWLRIICVSLASYWPM